MKTWRYDRELRRFWVCGCRIHHGFAGAFFFTLGLALMWHDRKDHWWLHDS